MTGIARSAYDDLFGSGEPAGRLDDHRAVRQELLRRLSARPARRPRSSRRSSWRSSSPTRSSKPWIMTNYLNTVPFGNNIYGVWAAAEDYFDINLTKPGATLSPAQAAMLAAMPNEPGVFTPDPTAGVGLHHARAALAVRADQHGPRRRHQPADGQPLCAQCALPQAEQAFNKSIQLNESAPGNGWTGTTGYLMQMVAAGTRGHLPLQPGEDRHRRAADHHHLQPADDAGHWPGRSTPRRAS